MVFLQAGMICNMTRLNRVYQRRLLLYIGNKRGLIGYGVGKGPLYEDAFIKAYQELRKNLIVINIDPNMTCASNLYSRFNDYKIKIMSTYQPNLWGSPLFCTMLRFAGLYHFGFTLISRKKDPYAMTFAMFKALAHNLTPTDMLERTGSKSYRHYIGRPRRYDYNITTGDNKY